MGEWGSMHCPPHAPTSPIVHTNGDFVFVLYWVPSTPPLPKALGVLLLLFYQLVEENSEERWAVICLPSYQKLGRVGVIRESLMKVVCLVGKKERKEGRKMKGRGCSDTYHHLPPTHAHALRRALFFPTHHHMLSFPLICGLHAMPLYFSLLLLQCPHTHTHTQKLLFFFFSVDFITKTLSGLSQLGLCLHSFTPSPFLMGFASFSWGHFDFALG